MKIAGLPLEPLLYAAVALSSGMLVYFAWAVTQAAYADYKKMYVAEAGASLGELFSTMEPERVFQLSLALAGLGLFLGAAAVNLILGLFLAAGFFFAPRLYFQMQRDKRRDLFAVQLVDALGMMASSLRAGLTLPQAMELVAREMPPPVSQEFGRVLQDYRLGTDFDDALASLARRVHSRDLDILVSSIAITRRSGGNVGEVFQNIASTIRERARVEGKMKAMASTATAQAIVLSGMPFGLMAALWFIEPEYIRLLFSTTTGLVAVGIVCFLVVVAFLWSRKIMDLDV